VTGISFRRGPPGEPGRGLTYLGLERTTRVLGMEHLTLTRLRQRKSRGPPLLVTQEDSYKKVSGRGIYIGGPLESRGTCNLDGGSCSGDFERCMKDGSSNGASLSEGLHEGDLEGGSLPGTPKDMLS